MLPVDALRVAHSTLQTDFDRDRERILEDEFLDDSQLDARVWASIASNLGDHEIENMRRIGKALIDALQLAERGALKESEYAFSELDRLITESDLGNRTRLLARGIFFAAAAYLDYKLRRWDDARQKVVEGLSCDERLEYDSGVSTLHLHRLNLAENLIRIERASGNSASAVKICKELLSYLAGCCQSPALPGNWGWQHLELPIGNIRHRFTSVAGELSICLVFLDPSAARRAFDFASEFMKDRFLPRCVDEHSLRWFDAKSCYIAHDMDGFLRSAEPILSRHPYSAGFGKIWCGTLLDVLSAMSDLSELEESSLRKFFEVFKACRFWNAEMNQVPAAARCFSSFL